MPSSGDQFGDGGHQGPTGLKCRDCPYQDIWHPVRTPRDRCKHDVVTDHDVDYVDPSEIRRSVDADGNVVIIHDEQAELVTDGGREQSTDGLSQYIIRGPSAGDDPFGRLLGMILWYRTWLMGFVVMAGVAFVGFIQGDLMSFAVGAATYLVADEVHSP